MERKVAATTVLLFIDPAGGTDYSTLICLTGFKFTRGKDIIDAATFCGPDTSPGKKSLGISFDGQQMLDPDSGKVSGHDLHDLWESDATVGWKIAPAIPAEGDVTYHGTGFVATLDDDYSLDNPSTFSGSLGIYGSATKTTIPGS